MEMYDLKPDAPSEYRGEFRPIHSNVPGMDVGELLPLHAKISRQVQLVRSVAHKFADHGGGHKRFMTARDPKEPIGFVNDHPAVPSMIAKVFENRRRLLPNYVSRVVDAGRQDIDTFSFGSADRIARRIRSSCSAIPPTRNSKSKSGALCQVSKNAIWHRGPNCSSSSTPGAADGRSLGHVQLAG